MCFDSIKIFIYIDEVIIIIMDDKNVIIMLLIIIIALLIIGFIVTINLKQPVVKTNNTNKATPNNNNTTIVNEEVVNYNINVNTSNNDINKNKEPNKAYRYSTPDLHQLPVQVLLIIQLNRLFLNLILTYRIIHILLSKNVLKYTEYYKQTFLSINY